MYNKHGRSPCDSNLRLNSVVHVYYNLYIYSIQMNKSIYQVNSLVLPLVRILSVRETNELSKYREIFILYLNRIRFLFKNFEDVF